MSSWIESEFDRFHSHLVLVSWKEKGGWLSWPVKMEWNEAWFAVLGGVDRGSKGIDQLRFVYEEHRVMTR